MIKPFADNESASSVDDLSIENGTIAVVLSGTLEITRDRKGLKRAQALKQLVDDLVHELEGTSDLPETVAPKTTASTKVENPFA